MLGGSKGRTKLCRTEKLKYTKKQSSLNVTQKSFNVFQHVSIIIILIEMDSTSKSVENVLTKLMKLFVKRKDLSCCK